jgi:uncharacterized protein YcfL
MQKLINAAIALTLLTSCSTSKPIAQNTNQNPQSSISQTSALVTQATMSTQQGTTQDINNGWVAVMNGNNPVVDGNNNQYFWHPPTLQRQGNQVTYLSMVILNTVDTSKPKISFGQMTANCQTGLFHAISGTIYNSSGQIINTISNSPEEIAQPGSINEVALVNICGFQPPTTEADLTRIQLEQLTRARQTNAEIINNAMQAGMNLAR